MADELIYVYCLADTPPDSDLSAEFSGLKFLVTGNFYAVLKMVSESEFSEENLKRNLNNIQWLDANVRAHIAVILRVMEGGCTAIPFKFGTIYNSTERLKEFVQHYLASLSENFDQIKGKQEWSVKIYYNRKTLSKMIDELSEEAASLEKQILASSPGKAFLLKRKKTELMENEMDRLCKKFGQEYFDDFKKISHAANIENIIPKEYTGRDDHMILNASFLVNKDMVANFSETVENLRKKNGNIGFFIEATGPWPPFSFVSIKEK